MTKDVLVTVKGSQFMSNGTDDIEIVVPGNYYKKNNKHYVIYEELIDGSSSMTKNRLKFDDKNFNLVRTGAVNVNMLFEENKRNISSYMTPFGELMVGFDVKKINVEETDNIINVGINYDLDVNYERMGNCNIEMSIKSCEQTD